MVTYASGSALKWSLLVLNSLNFIIITFVLVDTYVRIIGFEEKPIEIETSGEDNDLSSAITTAKPSIEVSTLQLNHKSSSPPPSSPSSSAETRSHANATDRFPSVGSNSVALIFTGTIFLIAMLGIVASNCESPKYLAVYGYLVFLDFFLKSLLLYATFEMNVLNYSYDPVSRCPLVLTICISSIQLILGLCACQYAKVLKRGSAAVPKIRNISELSA